MTTATLQPGQRFRIISDLNGHQHHRKAVYQITHVYDQFVSATDLNEPGKRGERASHSFHKNFLAESATPVDAPEAELETLPLTRYEAMCAICLSASPVVESDTPDGFLCLDCWHKYAAEAGHVCADCMGVANV